MRAVLDTNVIIAPFLSPKGVPALIKKAWEDEVFEVVTSEVLLSEYQEVLGYEEIATKHKMDQIKISKVIEGFRKYTIVVSPTQVPKVVTEDPDDDHLFAAALAGEASYIVTKNKHVLNIGEYQGIQILTPLAFLTLLEAEK